MPSAPSNGVLNSGAKTDFTNSADCRSCDLKVTGYLGRLHCDSNSRATVSVGENGFVTQGSFSVSSGANPLFNGGGTVDRPALHVGADGSATVADTAAANFDCIQIDAGSASGTPTNVTIMDG